MNTNILSKIILEFAEKKDFLTDSEIVLLAKKCDPDFNPLFKNILIASLMEAKIIYAYNLSRYKLYKERKEFVPYQDIEVERQLSTYIEDKHLKISYFHSSFYNSLSSLQIIKSYLFVCVESYAVDFLVDKVKKDNKKVITSNDLAKLRKLFSGIEFDFDFVIKTINIDTPLSKKQNKSFWYPKIETLLVDLISEKTLYDLYSSEIENIYINAFKQYAIKMNRLLRYAEKKGCKDKIKCLLKSINFNIERGEFDFD